MPDSTIDPTAANAERPERGGKRPLLAIVALCGAFLFVAPPFILDQDNVLIVAPCVIGSFCCSILFMRLVIGQLHRAKWSLLQAWAIVAIAAGREWYIVALLGVGVVSCSLIIDRLLGDFVPLASVVPLACVPDQRRA